MASIHKEIRIDARPEDVWDAIRDVGAIHRRLAPGFVVDTKLDGDARIVTFGNGMVVRELIVDIDDAARRLVWSVVGGPMTHHNASLQVFADGDGRSRVVWIADLLPNDLGRNDRRHDRARHGRHAANAGARSRQARGLENARKSAQCSAPEPEGSPCDRPPRPPCSRPQELERRRRQGDPDGRALRSSRRPTRRGAWRCTGVRREARQAASSARSAASRLSLPSSTAARGWRPAVPMEEDEEDFRATPLWFAVSRGENLPLVRFLLKRGADASYSLWAAVWRDDAVLCRDLLGTKPRLNLKAHGETPIFYAARLQRLKTLALLIDAGADPAIPDRRGRDAVDIARARRLPKDVIARLEDLKRGKQVAKLSRRKSV